MEAVKELKLEPSPLCPPARSDHRHGILLSAIEDACRHPRIGCVNQVTKCRPERTRVLDHFVEVRERDQRLVLRITDSAKATLPGREVRAVVSAEQRLLRLAFPTQRRWELPKPESLPHVLFEITPTDTRHISISLASRPGRFFAPELNSHAGWDTRIDTSAAACASVRGRAAGTDRSPAGSYACS